MNIDPASMTPEVPLASKAPPRPPVRRVAWPRGIMAPVFVGPPDAPHMARWWLLRQLRRTLAHEAAQAIIDDDRGRT